MISINTMYVIPFSGILGNGILFNINLYKFVWMEYLIISYCGDSSLLKFLSLPI